MSENKFRPTVQSTAELFGRFALVVWWGGLTFYAAIVVPAGSELLGSYEQGTVTQSVTHWLNSFCLVMLLLLIPSVVAGKKRLCGVAIMAIAVSLVALFFIHRRLDRLMVVEPYDFDRFYSVHRQYLIATTMQWLAGLFLLYEYCLSGSKQQS